MNKLPSISSALKKVVQATEDAIIADSAIVWGTLPKKLYFMHGHPREIVQRLADLGKGSATKNKKYPLIALFRDIKELPKQGGQGFDTGFNAKLVICTLTTRTFRADEREVKNFIPILHPIFEHFIDQLSQSSDFGCPTVDDMKIVKWDRYYWGTEPADKQILFDSVDAVEIENITLKQQYLCGTLRINN